MSSFYSQVGSLFASVNEQHVLLSFKFPALVIILLRVEMMFFPWISRKAFQRHKYKKVWHGKTYLGENRRLPPRSAPGFPMFHLHPSCHEQIQFCLHQGQKWGQCPDNLCHIKAQSFGAKCSLLWVPGSCQICMAAIKLMRMLGQ